MCATVDACLVKEFLIAGVVTNPASQGQTQHTH